MEMSNANRPLTIGFIFDLEQDEEFGGAFMVLSLKCYKNLIVRRGEVKFFCSITSCLGRPHFTLVYRRPHQLMPFLPGAFRHSLKRKFRYYATTSLPQTRIEKIVQKYAVDLSSGTKVRAGDYVMIKPEHV